jgi:hypothetical protein
VDQAALLDNWRAQKTTRTVCRLLEPRVATYEYQGQFGHPSSYVLVGFQCRPADELTLDFATP